MLFLKSDYCISDEQLSLDKYSSAGEDGAVVGAPFSH